MKLGRFALLLLFAAQLARASEPASFLGGGYLLTRGQLFGIDDNAILHPILEVEPRQAFLELSGDGQVHFLDHFSARGDLSALFRAVPAGCRANGPSLCLVINELNVEWRPVEPLRFLVGRHRPSWAFGLAAHPAEPLLPSSDPTDPAYQRLGSWMGLGELSSGLFTATAVFAPKITHSAIGLPDSFSPYGTAAARIAYRPAGFEVAGLGYYDFFYGRPSGGAAASGTVAGLFEVHGEALVHNRNKIKTGDLEEGSCPGIRSVGIPWRDQLDVSALLGARYDAENGSLVSLEYLHNADGLTNQDFQTVLNTVDVIKAQCPDARITPTDVSEEGRPSQFSSIFLKRSYLLLVAADPRLRDEGVLSNFSVTGSVVAGLDDLSLAASARVAYTLQDRVIFRVGALGRLGGATTQYGALPFIGLLLGDVQVSF